MSEYYIGLMSGTSVDAIDAVLMDFSKSNTNIAASCNHQIDSKLKNEINRAIAKQIWPQNVKELDLEFANASIQAVENLLEQASIQSDQIAAIGSHGQTIFHNPSGTPPITIQIGNAQHIANNTRISTVANFRQADIDAGGQGAPLACAYHAEVLRSVNENRIILNLGGIANITLLPADTSTDIIGFDTGPANTLLDAWIKKHRGKEFDKNGTWANSGRANLDLLSLLLKDKYFKQPPPKSTGREKFNLTWLQHILDKFGAVLPEQDIQATLVTLTSKTISNAIHTWAPQAKRILLCGGGSNNDYLVSELQRELSEIPIQGTSTHNVPENWMEAMAFAWLAKQKLIGNPGNIPSVTGALKKVALGEIFNPKQTAIT